MRARRASIAGLMGFVLVTAMGLAALRSPSDTWAGVLFYSAAGVFALGIVGVVCGGSAERAWWLGFVLFGSGYLALAFGCPFFFLPTPPITSLLAAIEPHVVVVPPPGGRQFEDTSYRDISHSLGSLVAAVIGGALARALFGNPAAPSDGPGDECLHETRRPKRRWRRLAVVVVAFVVSGMAAVLFGAGSAPGLWAGTTVLLTWGVVGLTAIAALCGRSRHRAACLGATLFGAGYMLLVAAQPVAIIGGFDNQPWPQFATNRLLNSLRPWLPRIVSEFPAASDGVAFANARILRALDQTVPMRFPRETPLKDVLAYVATATRSPDGRDVPIYVDPFALRDAEATLESPVTINLENVPLRTSLDLALNQLGLTYVVKGGVIEVNTGTDPDTVACSDPFLVVGQCLLALLAAGFGCALGALIHCPESEQADNTVASPIRPEPH